MQRPNNWMPVITHCYLYTYLSCFSRERKKDRSVFSFLVLCVGLGSYHLLLCSISAGIKICVVFGLWAAFGRNIQKQIFIIEMFNKPDRETWMKNNTKKNVFFVILGANEAVHRWMGEERSFMYNLYRHAVNCISVWISLVEWMVRASDDDDESYVTVLRCLCCG